MSKPGRNGHVSVGDPALPRPHTDATEAPTGSFPLSHLPPKCRLTCPACPGSLGPTQPTLGKVSHRVTWTCPGVPEAGTCLSPSSPPRLGDLALHGYSILPREGPPPPTLPPSPSAALKTILGDHRPQDSFQLIDKFAFTYRAAPLRGVSVSCQDC